MQASRYSGGLASRLWWLVGLSLAGFAALAGVTLYFDIRAIEEERQVATRHIVESAHAVVARFHDMQQAGQLSEADAKARALEALRAVRYGDNDYIFVSDMAVRSCSH